MLLRSRRRLTAVAGLAAAAALVAGGGAAGAASHPGAGAAHAVTVKLTPAQHKAAAKKAAAAKAAKAAAAKKAAAKKAAAKKPAATTKPTLKPTPAPAVKPTPAPTVTPTVTTDVATTTTGGGGGGGTTTTTTTASFSGALFRDSFWTRSIASAPLSAGSASSVANLTSQVTTLWNGVAAFNVWDYNTTIYQATASTPRRNVLFTDCQGKGYTPSVLTGADGWFQNVPVPVGAVAASGTDEEMAIYDAATDQLWEFWQAEWSGGQLHACWGGRLDHASTSQGFFPDSGGATASGLPISAGVITIAEARALKIDHAMTLEVPAPAAGVFSWPAQRTDGYSSDVGAPVEGQRFRLDPTVNVNALPLTPLAKAIARAAQTYGFIISDTAGAVAVQTESGDAAVAAGGVNPWTAILGSTPAYAVMQNFPWTRMQALPLNYGQS